MKLRDIIAKSELDYYKQHINFTHDEEIVFDMLSKGKSIKEVADKLNASESTVGRRGRSVRSKIEQCIDGENARKSVPIWEKLNLTLEEASEYSNIGINKIRELTKQKRCPFVICIGRKKLIKRKEFEKYLENQIEI